MRHEYIRIHSAKVKLASHADKEARLWARLNTRADWSAELVSTATVADLDSTALAVGRQRFAEKHLHLAGEVAGWDVLTLLSKPKLSRGGQLTRAALLLFGKDESAQFLPLPPQVSWVLKDAAGTVLDSAYYRELVLQHLRNFTACKREELEAVLRAKLPDVLSGAQKRNRVKNLLADLSRQNLIAPERKGPGARWRLVPKK